MGKIIKGASGKKKTFIWCGDVFFDVDILPLLRMWSVLGYADKVPKGKEDDFYVARAAMTLSRAVRN